MRYTNPVIHIYDFVEEDSMLQTTSPVKPEEEKVNVTFQTIVNTDFDSKVEIEL